MKKLHFPQDEKPHRSIGEWWYINGHLTDAKKKSYAFMYTIFRVDPKKAGVSFLKVLPVESIYFPHSVLTNVSAQQAEARISYLALHSHNDASDLLSLTCSLPLGRHHAPHRLEETKPFEYALQTDQVNLTLKALKPPLLIGGTGIMKFEGKPSYYYTIPRLKAGGTIQWKGKTVAVKGLAWMDHQWAEVPYAHYEWTWFAMQLSNKTDILVSRYTEGGKEKRSVNISFADGTQQTGRDFELTEKAAPWKSRATKAQYQLNWRIQIPSIDLDVEVAPMVKQQELIFGKMNYWEGPLVITGRMAGKKIHGKGFLELVGRPAKYADIGYIRTLLKQVSE